MLNADHPLLNCTRILRSAGIDNTGPLSTRKVKGRGLVTLGMVSHHSAMVSYVPFFKVRLLSILGLKLLRLEGVAIAIV